MKIKFSGGDVKFKADELGFAINIPGELAKHFTSYGHVYFGMSDREALKLAKYIRKHFKREN